MKIEVLLMTLMVGLVLGVNGDCHPILAPKRNSNLNPVLLSLTYCSNSSKFQSYDATGQLHFKLLRNTGSRISDFCLRHSTETHVHGAFAKGTSFSVQDS